MQEFHYTARDRKGGAVLYESSITAASKTEARRLILDAARRDTPGGRGRSASDYGYVPVSDYRITFTN